MGKYIRPVSVEAGRRPSTDAAADARRAAKLQPPARGPVTALDRLEASVDALVQKRKERRRRAKAGRPPAAAAAPVVGTVRAQWTAEAQVDPAAAPAAVTMNPPPAPVADQAWRRSGTGT